MQMTIQSLLNEEHLPYTLGNTRVFLDGEEIKDCVMLDTKEHWLEVYKKDESGNIMAENGEIVTEVLYGDVQVTTKENDDE